MLAADAPARDARAVSHPPHVAASDGDHLAELFADVVPADDAEARAVAWLKALLGPAADVLPTSAPKGKPRRKK